MNKNRPPYVFLSIAILLAAQALVPRPATAAESVDPPQIIAAGYQALHLNGVKSAVASWTRGGVLEDTDGAARIISELEHLVDLFGPFRSFHVIEAIEISGFSRIVYVESAHKEGPIYMRFPLFLRPQGWVVIDLLANAIPEKVFPAWVLKPEPPSDTKTTQKTTRRRGARPR